MARWWAAHEQRKFRFRTLQSALAGAKPPENDLEGKRCIFDSYDMSPLLFGTGKSQRTTWFYFTEKKISA